MRFIGDDTVKKDGVDELGTYSINDNGSVLLVTFGGKTELYVFKYFSPLVKTYAYCRVMQTEAITALNAVQECGESVENFDENIDVAKKVAHYGLFVTDLTTLSQVSKSIETAP